MGTVQDIAGQLALRMMAPIGPYPPEFIENLEDMMAASFPDDADLTGAGDDRRLAAVFLSLPTSGMAAMIAMAPAIPSKNLDRMRFMSGFQPPKLLLDRRRARLPHGQFSSEQPVQGLFEMQFPVGLFLSGDGEGERSEPLPCDLTQFRPGVSRHAEHGAKFRGVCVQPDAAHQPAPDDDARRYASAGQRRFMRCGASLPAAPARCCAVPLINRTATEKERPRDKIAEQVDRPCLAISDCSYSDFTLTFNIPFGILNVMKPASPTRIFLLDQALRLFSAYGYEGVGVQQICNDAGVGKPTLYHYFGSKLGLLETLLKERLAPLHQELERACALTPFDHALVALAETTFAFAREEPQLYRFYLTLWFAPVESEARQAAEEHHQRHFEAFDACFRAHEQAFGHGLTGRHRLLAASFLGLVNNHIGIALNSFATLNARSAADTAAMFLNGALPPASSNGD